MNRLRELRKNNKLTQEDCAKIAFISKKSYERYENGLREPPISVLMIFCKYYNVSINYILGDTISYEK